jgi:2-polyprenyl-3-methyl-5-hydroxy-6-metoxy-1,4-benzoquinol methylase
MQKDEQREIIRLVHERVAPQYGDLDLHGRVAANSLPHWNYLRNVKGPIERIVADFLPVRPFVMLDAGCGNGQLFHLYTALGAGVIYGVDFCERMLREAQRRAEANNIRFIPLLARLEDLQCYKEASFHLINLYGIIEHLPEPVRVLKELERLLRPDGLLIFGVPRKWSLAWATYRLFGGSLERMVRKPSLSERILGLRKMALYRFYTASDTMDFIRALDGMTLTARLPVASGGMVGSPARLLRRLAAEGKYAALDGWEKWAKAIGLIPAGEYVVMRKSAPGSAM